MAVPGAAGHHKALSTQDSPDSELPVKSLPMLSSATLATHRSRFDMNTAAVTVTKTTANEDSRLDFPTLTPER